MSDLRSLWDIGQDTALRERCCMAIYSKAAVVVQDNTTPPAIAAFARSVILGPEQYTTPLARAVAISPGNSDKVVFGNPLDTSGITDADIAAALEIAWTVMTAPLVQAPA